MEGLEIEIKARFEIQFNQFEDLIIGYIGYIKEKNPGDVPKSRHKEDLRGQGKALLNTTEQASQRNPFKKKYFKKLELETALLTTPPQFIEPWARGLLVTFQHEQKQPVMTSQQTGCNTTKNKIRVSCLGTNSRTYVLKKHSGSTSYQKHNGAPFFGSSCQFPCFHLYLQLNVLAASAC